MNATSRVIAGCCVGALFLASCGSSSSDSAKATSTTAKPKAATTTVPVDQAVLAFCGDAKAYLTALNSLSTGIEKSITTVGDVKTAADEAKKASSAASASKDTLIGAIEAEAAAAASSGATTTTLVAKDVATAHLDALAQAEQDAATAIASIDQSTLVSDASASVQAAAFNLQLASLALYDDAGCLGADSADAAALHEIIAGLQQDLTTIGLYSGPIDGLYGPDTVAAVTTLQKNAGLPETGFMDPASQKALADELAKANKQESLEIAAIQGALTSGGYYTGPIDGIWSAEVDAAIQALQADQDQAKTGATDPATLIALGAALANAANQTTTTAVPMTAAPTTAAPDTAAPTTAVPTTAVPTTATPTTMAPETTTTGP